MQPEKLRGVFERNAQFERICKGRRRDLNCPREAGHWSFAWPTGITSIEMKPHQIVPREMVVLIKLPANHQEVVLCLHDGVNLSTLAEPVLK